MSASDCAVKKKKTKLTFQIERSIRPGEEKQIQASKFSQFKAPFVCRKVVSFWKVNSGEVNSWKVNSDVW